MVGIKLIYSVSRFTLNQTNTKRTTTEDSSWSGLINIAEEAV